MPNTWFRLYAEFAHDPKVQMLSEAMQRRYIMLLCLRCGNDHVTLHETEVAFQLRISETEWADTKAVLMDRGLIDEQNRPSAWDKRQFESDSSAGRVARHRARKKHSESPGPEQCNVTVTPQIQKQIQSKQVNPCSPDGEQSPLPQKAQRQEKKFGPQRYLEDLGVDPSTASDWLQIRRAKKSPATETAIKGIASEAAKAGISLQEALSNCCTRGWVGFKAEWVQKPPQPPPRGSPQLNGRDAGILSAARTIFGTGIEAHGTPERRGNVIDADSAAAGALGAPNLR